MLFDCHKRFPPTLKGFLSEVEKEVRKVPGTKSEKGQVELYPAVEKQHWTLERVLTPLNTLNLHYLSFYRNEMEFVSLGILPTLIEIIFVA